MAARILVVDDERNIRRTMRMVLEGEGFEVLDAASGEDALLSTEQHEIDLMILDVRLPKIDGIEVLRKLRANRDHARMPVIMISGHASVAEAVNAVQLGATDFFEKPLDRDRVLIGIRNALRTSQLEREVAELRASTQERYEMVGESEAMQKLYAQLEKVAPTHGRVLVVGESGTGKELVARALHRLSPRAKATFVKVNCAAIPSDLIESELFGHERGAFTGATNRKKGMFELADGGTLFLDEIGDMSLSAQAKVLRALQNGEITRVGSEQTIGVDVRVVAATNKDLEKAVSDGTFREDLYFRLNVVPLRTPSLRERKEDVPALAKTFLERFCQESAVRAKEIDDDVLEALQERPWPGNVRELKNVIERMAILSGERIELDDLPELPRLSLKGRDTVEASLPSTGFGDDALSLKAYRELAEKSYIVKALERHDWNISQTATSLGVERTNLHKKMRSYGIKRA